MIDLGFHRLLRSHPAPVAAVLVGLTVLLGAGALFDPAGAFSGMLVATLFGIMLAAGAAVFAALQGAAGAGWWISLRPAVSAIASAFVVPAAFLALTLGLGLTTLYRWTRPGSGVAPDVARTWFSAPCFLARGFVVLLLLGVAIAYLRRGLAEEDGPVARKRFGTTSVRFLLLAAPCLAVGFWDWGMSLEAPWVSTMYAFYGFAGTILSGIAVVTAVTLLPGRGPAGLDAPPSPPQRHDLGMLLFAFGMFWAYIWFSQYLLVWYTNLPDEIPHYIARMSRGWAPIFWLNPILSFAVPFVALLSQRSKRSGVVLGQVAAVVLLGRWIDVWLLVAPALGPVPAFPVHAVAATLLVLFGMGLVAEGVRGRAPADVHAIAA